MSDLIIIISLLVAWYVYYYEYTPSVIQETRAKLFEIRDDLMHSALSGEIPYEDTMHELLRDTLNHIIGVTHRLSWIRAYMLSRSIKKYDLEDFEQFKITLEKYLDSKPSAQRKIYEESMQRIDRTLINHMNKESIIAIVISSFIKFLNRALKQFDFLNSILVKIRALKNQSIDAIDFNAGSASLRFC